MTRMIPVVSEQKLTPRAAEVIRAIADEAFPNETISFFGAGPLDLKVLVFGKVPEGFDTKNRELVYTYSVAQIMAKPNAASVLKAGLQQMLGTPEPVPFLNPVAIYSAGTLEKLVDFDFTKPTAIDIETSGNLGVTHTPEEVKIISVAFYQEGQPPYVLVERGREQGKPANGLLAGQLSTLARVLPKFEFGIYHNGKFDIRVLNRVLGIELVNSFDTMLAHHVLNQAAADHKLKTLARRYLGAPEWEADLKKWTTGGGYYENIPAGWLVEYNGWDVYWTYKLYGLLAPQIMADESAQTAFMFEMQIAEFLLEVEQYGIPFDRKYADTYAKSLEGKQSSAKNQIKKIVGFELNPNSPKQVKEWFESAGIHMPKSDEAALKAIVEADPNADIREVAKLILEFRKAGKMRGTYAVGWAKHEREGRVRPTFLVHGTTTGRLSSTGPNAQNVPRDKTIRKIVAINE